MRQQPGPLRRTLDERPWSLRLKFAFREMEILFAIRAITPRIAQVSQGHFRPNIAVIGFRLFRKDGLGVSSLSSMTLFFLGTI